MKGASVKGRNAKTTAATETHPLRVDADGQVHNLAVDSISEPETAMRASMNQDDFQWLKDSMLDIGLLYPLLVFPKNGGYEVADGHRRLLAARDLGWVKIACLIFEGPRGARGRQAPRESNTRSGESCRRGRVYRPTNRQAPSG